MIQFYTPDIEATKCLTPDDSLHCVKVLRHQPGDIISIVDGKGSRFKCEVLDADRKRVTVEILERESVPGYWSGNLNICVAPTKNMDRIDWLVEKLVEIGVDEITMLECRNSERKVVKTDRLERIAISAMKQSLKAALPTITEITPFKKFIEASKELTGQKFICYCDDLHLRRQLAKELVAGENVTILIGPEGDFSPEEVEMAIAAGFMPTTLGEARLRTETAALYSATTFHIINTLNR